MAQIDLKHATIFLKDNSGHSLEVKIGEGNLTYSEKRTIEPVLSRGTLDTIRLGEEIPVNVTLAFIWEFLRADGSDPPSVEEVLKHVGNASTWVSTSSDTNAPFCVDCEIIYTPPCSTVKKEVILLSQFHYTDLAHSLKDGTVDIQAICNITQPTIVRTT